MPESSALVEASKRGSDWESPQEEREWGRIKGTYRFSVPPFLLS